MLYILNILTYDIIMHCFDCHFVSLSILQTLDVHKIVVMESTLKFILMEEEVRYPSSLWVEILMLKREHWELLMLKTNPQCMSLIPFLLRCTLNCITPCSDNEWGLVWMLKVHKRPYEWHFPLEHPLFPVIFRLDKRPNEKEKRKPCRLRHCNNP